MPIDVATILTRHSLASWLDRDLGQADRSGKRLCPFHDDHNPSFGVKDDRFRCWSARCEASGNLIDYVMRRERLSFVDACRRIDPYAVDDSHQQISRSLHQQPSVVLPEPKSNPPKVEPWRDMAWQSEVHRLVLAARKHLRSEAGKPVLRWLAARGIEADTTERFGLGYLPQDCWSRKLSCLSRADGKPRAIWARRGLVIPWLAPGETYDFATEPSEPRWVGVNVRRFADDLYAKIEEGPKYQTFGGSARGYGYPYPDLQPSQFGPPALILEGEFDALLAMQELGWLVHPFSVGGASQTDIALPTRAALASCPWWLLALDHDDSGLAAVERWQEYGPHKARRVMLPFGKDLTECWQEGEPLRPWIVQELKDLED